MAKAYAKTERRAERRRTQELASAFWPDRDMERLLKLKEARPAEFDTLSPTLRMSVGMYEARKDAHEALKGGTK
jgi:hypothetical protein